MWQVSFPSSVDLAAKFRVSLFLWFRTRSVPFLLNGPSSTTKVFFCNFWGKFRGYLWKDRDTTRSHFFRSLLYSNQKIHATREKILDKPAQISRSDHISYTYLTNRRTVLYYIRFSPQYIISSVSCCKELNSAGK